MKFSSPKFFLLIFCSFFLSLHAEEEITDKASGTKFPQEVSFEHEGKEFHLQATGAATRKKLIVKVYSVAHYLQEGKKFHKSDILQEIMKDANAKQLTIKWLYGVSAEKVQNGYQDSFKKALGSEEYRSLENDINKYVSLFTQDVQKGDEHVLRWLPGGDIEVSINDQAAGTIVDKDFAKGLWSIWFGPHSVVDRNSLISLVQ